jgi:DNA polymerase-3 subunit delta'
VGFSDIIGNKKVLKLLEQGVLQKTLYPSLIFHGIEGIGKKRTAFTIAKGFNCLSETGKPCDLCSVCNSIDHLNDPDARLILPEWYDERLDRKERKSLSIKIDQIRELVRDINLRPYHSAKKIYIIDYAEMLTDEASNSLLKTLEEPPPYAIIILITTAYYSLLPTIRSRCWGVPFHPLPPREIEEFLLRKAKMDLQTAKKLSVISEGSIKKALQADPKDFTARSGMLLTMIEKAVHGDLSFVIKGAEEISKNAEEFSENLNVLLSLYRDMIAIRKTDDPTLMVNAELGDRLKPLAYRIGHEALEIIEAIDETKNLLRININKKVAAEALFFHLHPSSFHPG